LNGLPPKLPHELEGHKFHLRAYCVASGALQLYLYTRVLALFSSKPYKPPGTGDGIQGTDLDLEPHLTNSSLQSHRGEEGVRLFDELEGCHVLSQPGRQTRFTMDHISDIREQMCKVLAETFQAAVDVPVHFQPLPNAFEMYGVDFLVSHSAGSPSEQLKFQVKLLEINAEPAIELTGPRLTWILEDLFRSIAKVTIEPFVAGEVNEVGWQTGQIRHFLQKCMDTEVRGAASW